MYDIKLTDSAGNETIAQIGTNCVLVTDINGNKIPVPDGFSPITTSDQGTKETGFVIKNDTDGNEFVWVPVEGMGYSYDRYAFSANQPANEIDNLTNSIKIRYSSSSPYFFTEELPVDEHKSVAMYGGFYIGRYETGVVGATLDTTEIVSQKAPTDEWTGYKNGEAIIQKGSQVWNYITIKQAQKEAEKLYNQENGNVIISKLCSSYAWDTALKFIETQNSIYLTNSIGGNYTNTIQNTGYDTVHPCNIYDMGGNVWEHTTGEINYPDANDPWGVNRGGSIGYSMENYSAFYRSYCILNGVYNNIGFRVTLFL